MKKLFFIAYGGGHIKMLIPIIKYFRNYTNYDVTVFGLTTACSVLEKENIPYISYQTFATQHTNDIGMKLLKNEETSSLISPNESIAYHGINYIDLINQLGENKAELVWKEKKRQCFNPINFFITLLKEIKPDLVIATNSPRSEKAALDASRYLNITSICLVDMFALQAINWLSQKDYASKICVLNNSVRDMFIQHGCSPESVVVTGNPAFDSINDKKYCDDALKLRHSLCMNNDDKLIVYASQPEPEQHPFCDKKGNPGLPREIEIYLRNYIKNNKNKKLVLRYHPSENTIFNEQKNIFHSKKSDSLYTLLHAADLVIVTASTVGLEASLIGKNVLSIDTSIFTDDAPFSKMGISIGVKRISDLEYHINKILAPANQNRIKYDINEADATKKIINVIKSITC